MAELLFFLRFKTQLRRTRPELVQQVDEAIRQAVADVGGTITTERSLLKVSFDEGSLGFWLDMLILIERMKKVLEPGPQTSNTATLRSPDFATDM